tara:strand:- start:1391 stop:1930 length:540 start_codon:yes stop_codon:yes gene_type:complete
MITNLLEENFLKVKNNSKQINIPSFIETNFIFSCVKSVKIRKVYIGLTDTNSKKIRYVNIKSTPHYKFACDYLKNKYKINESRYVNYIKSNPKDFRSTEKFIKLIDSFNKSGYNYEEFPVLVFKTLKRPFPFGRFDVADGFHRLSILAALGYENINVAVLKRKQSIFTRLKKKLNEIFE